MRSKEPAQPVVLLVNLDGGVAGRILSRDPTLDVNVIDTFADVREGLATVVPDVVVVAIEQPSARHAADLGALVRAAAPPILVFSKPAEGRPVTDVIKTGVGGYLFTGDAVRLPDAIRELLRGGVPMSRAVSQLVLGRARRSSSEMRAVKVGDPDTVAFITTRQREILKLLASGHSYGDIAIALDVSVNTVRTHVRTIYERLGASTKVEAVITAMELRILDPEPLG